MRAHRTILFGLFGVAMAASSITRAGVYVPVIPVSGAEEGSTAVLGINDNNVIVGSYYTSDGVQHGFFGTLDGNYTTFDIGVSFTDARGISNDGSISGDADDKKQYYFPFERLPDGSTKPITPHGKSFYDGLAQGFNSNNVLVGYGIGVRFTFDNFYAKKGKYSGDVDTPAPPPYLATKGVNKAKEVDGDYYGADDRDHGFYLQNGSVTQIDYPDASTVDTYLGGLNNKNIAAGDWVNSDFVHHGFMVDLTSAIFTPLSPPHAVYSQAWGVNNAGLVAVTSDAGSFIYCPRKTFCPAAGVEVADAATIHVASFPLVRKSGVRPLRAIEKLHSGSRTAPLWWRRP